MNGQQRIDIARADAAKRIMEDPMVKEALTEIERMLMEKWARTGSMETATREHLHRLLLAKDMFVSMFVAYMQSGTIAADALRAEEERKGLMARMKERIYG